MGEFSGLIMLFAFLLLLVVGVLVYSFLSMYLKLKKIAAEREDKGSVGFVVDTFHGLVAQLKDKERELEALRQAAETRADITEEYNENILQSVPSGVISMDADWKVVKVNAAAGHLLGLDHEGLTGRDGREVLPEIISRPAPAAPLPERVMRGECVYSTSSGKRLWLGYSLTPLKDAGGQEIGHILVFTDLTELRALEAQSALRARLSSLGEMAAGIAHELRNSMGAIAGYMRLLKNKAGPDAGDTLDKVTAEVGVMDRIVGDFLSFARPGEPRLEDVDLSELARECALAFTPEDGSVEVVANSTETVTVRADEVFLRQALSNLIQNAVHASKEGSKVFVDVALVGSKAVLKVSDTGHGMDPAIKDRIFDPFFTTKDQGTGLGLAIVHRSVTSLGGTVQVESSDKGTTFTLTLPVT